MKSGCTSLFGETAANSPGTGLFLVPKTYPIFCHVGTEWEGRTGSGKWTLEI